MDLQDILNRGRDEDGHQLRKPLLDHFQDLLVHVRRSFYWLIACCGVTYFFAKDLVILLKVPMERASAIFPADKRPEVIITRPFEEVWTYLQVAMYLGIFLALPFLVYEAGGFIGPGLKRSERQKIKTLILTIYLVFVLGVFLSYRFALEPVLHAVMTYGGGLQSLKWTLSSYISTIVGIILAFSILLELPVVMVYLSRWGWVDPYSWRKGWKIALVGNAVISGILSPPDVLSMFVVMVPMQLLYELGIILAKIFTEKKGPENKPKIEKV